MLFCDVIASRNQARENLRLAEADLYEACHRLLSDREAANTMGERARTVVA